MVWKGAHFLGCGKTFVNGEPYYIAQMDTPGVIASVPGYDKSNVGEPKEVRCILFSLGEGRDGAAELNRIKTNMGILLGMLVKF